MIPITVQIATVESLNKGHFGAFGGKIVPNVIGMVPQQVSFVNRSSLSQRVPLSEVPLYTESWYAVLVIC